MVPILKTDSTEVEKIRYREFMIYLRKRMKELEKEEEKFREAIKRAKNINKSL